MGRPRNVVRNSYHKKSYELTVREMPEGMPRIRRRTHDWVRRLKEHAHSNPFTYPGYKPIDNLTGVIRMVFLFQLFGLHEAASQDGWMDKFLEVSGAMNDPNFDIGRFFRWTAAKRVSDWLDEPEPEEGGAHDTE